MTTAAYATAGVLLPRTADTQYHAVLPPQQLPRPGDLVFWGAPAVKVHHVGLYLGGGLMLNAPTFGLPVQISPMRNGGSDYTGAGRPSG